jgi:hypothetical protein
MNLLDDDLAHRVKELISQYSSFAYTIALAESLTGGIERDEGWNCRLQHRIESPAAEC